MSVHTTHLSWRRTLTPFVVACTVVAGGVVRASAQDAATATAGALPAFSVQLSALGASHEDTGLSARADRRRPTTDGYTQGDSQALKEDATTVEASPAPAPARQAPAKPNAAPQAPSKPGATAQAPAKPSTPPAKPAAAPAAKAPAAAGPAFTFQGFGSIGYTAFAASDTFNAVLGSSGGLVYGGGVTVTHRRGYFGRVSVEHFSGDGERVFVYGGEVFPLGIPLSVSMTPIDITGGYRFLPKPRPAARPPTVPPRRPTFQPARPGPTDKGQPSPAAPRPPASMSPTPAPRKWIPYVGGGVGFMSYKETSEFAEPGEDVNETFTTYNLLGGVEYRVSKWIGATGELGWRLVPNALEDSYLGQQFGEKDLGGFTFRALVTVGR